ncbi:MAG: DUF86 domain-containing protein [Bacillota bacterium]
MPPEERDAAYLWDMLDAAKTVRSMIEGVAFDGYVRNRMLRLAVERAIEIIGEAACHVSPGFRQSHPDILWRGIMAQRHVLAHEYGDIDHELIWRVATVHIPDLIAKLEPLVPLPPNEEG